MKLRCHNHAAFTLVEIAIALAVIAFALVAIIGVLPSGMQVNRDNRLDTVINRDGAYLLEAIRTSAQNIPDLVKFVESIDGMPVDESVMTSSNVVQLMSEPNGPHVSIFRSITGPAVMRGTGVPTFRYMVIYDIRQLDNVNTNLPWAGALRQNSYEVRLVFFFPLPPGSTNVTDTAQKQVMRTVITGTWDVTNRVFNLAEYQP